MSGSAASMNRPRRSRVDAGGIWYVVAVSAKPDQPAGFAHTPG